MHLRNREKWENYRNDATDANFGECLLSLVWGFGGETCLSDLRMDEKHKRDIGEGEGEHRTHGMNTVPSTFLQLNPDQGFANSIGNASNIENASSARKVLDVWVGLKTYYVCCWSCSHELATETGFPWGIPRHADIISLTCEIIEFDHPVEREEKEAIHIPLSLYLDSGGHSQKIS